LMILKLATQGHSGVTRVRGQRGNAGSARVHETKDGQDERRYVVEPP
jgi:hypothetical protein